MNEESFDPGKEARTASGIPVVPAFDGYRAWAIFLASLYHVCLFSGLLFAAGTSWRAVAIFAWLAEVPLTMLFITSGFVLFLPTVARDGQFGRVGAFWVRRAARIFPAYWLVLVIAIIVLALIPAAGPIPSASSIVLHFSMLQTPATLFDTDVVLGFGVVAAVWTLPVEIAFYVLLPIIASSYYRRPIVGLAIAAALFVAWRLFAVHIGAVGDAFGINISDGAQYRWSVFYSRQFPSWALSVAAGMTGAWAFVRVRERYAPDVLAQRARLVAIAAAIATLVVTAFAGTDALHNPDVLNGIFAYGSMGVGLALPLVVATAMVAISLSPPRMQVAFTARPMRYLGDISFGVYLIHLALIIIAVRKLGFQGTGTLLNFAELCLLVFPASFLFAYLSATYLEHPVRRWARRLTTRRPERPAGPTGPPAAQAAGSAGR